MKADEWTGQVVRIGEMRNVNKICRKESTLKT
jgi:hypothetical protein